MTDKLEEDCQTIAREIEKAHRMATIDRAKPVIERGLGIKLSWLDRR